MFTFFITVFSRQIPREQILLLLRGSSVLVIYRWKMKMTMSLRKSVHRKLLNLDGLMISICLTQVAKDVVLVGYHPFYVL